MRRDEPNIRSLRKSWPVSLIAAMALLFQAMLVIGHASAVIAGDLGNKSGDYPFGQLVICTPSGIAIISENGTQNEDQNKSKSGTFCSLCVNIATGGLVSPVFDIADAIPEWRSLCVSWHITSSLTPYPACASNNHARAPPFGLFT